MAGKYGIGARVRDEDGDSGTIVGKRKGERQVEYDLYDCTKLWWPKSSLSPIPANDDTPAPAEQEQGGEPAEKKFKVGDRVRTNGMFTFDPNEGVIVEIYNDLYKVKVVEDGSGGDIWSYYESELTMLPATEPTPEWQPKVGDRVRVVKHCNYEGEEIPLHLPIGAESVITKITNTLAHAGVTTFRLEGGGMNFYTPLNVEPLPVAAQAQPADPAPAEPAPLTIEAGKFYRTRDGRKVGPIYRSCRVDWPWESEVAYHKADGTAPYLPHYDLIAECVDEPKAGVTAIFDELEAWLGEDNPVAVAPATATPIKKRDLVTLARPAMVTGFDPNNPSVAHVVLGTGGAYTLPVAALVAA